MISYKHLWGKKSFNGMPYWLPLIIHLNDTAEIGRLIWDRWLSSGGRNTITDSLKFTREDIAKAEQSKSLFIYLCAIHDLGKAIPDFQLKCSKVTGDSQDSDMRRQYLKQASDMDALYKKKLEDDGFIFPDPSRIIPKISPHAHASQIIAEEFGEIHRNIAYILGAHHGKPSNSDEIHIDSYPSNFYGGKAGKEAWQTAWRQLLDNALAQTPFRTTDELPIPKQYGAVLLTGLLIMADWIASNESFFPYIGTEDAIHPDQSSRRAARAWETIKFTHPWHPVPTEHLFSKRFGFNAPNEIQRALVSAATQVESPGIFVLEAPMGIGKTEAALCAAEILAARTGHSGVFFALPTQATSNGIFDRMEQWAEHLNDDNRHSIELFHGKAQFNESFSHIRDSSGIGEDSEDAVFVHTWFNGRKKSMLADFVVGTIDQILLAALKQKHFMLRHLGLANKIVIIDECHAYDAYMGVYLERVLSWLGTYHIPVIVLSATLPSARRESVIRAYLKKSTRLTHKDRCFLESEISDANPDVETWQNTSQYPLLTYTDGKEIESHPIILQYPSQTVRIKKIEEIRYTELLQNILADGGCAGIIVNSVAKAQTCAEALKKIFREEEIILSHSRFLAPDRAVIEQRINHCLGKPSLQTERPDRLVVIGTQVLEQSLDIDFDVLFTDLCPIDLLLQRIGRLHRHPGRTRPQKLSTPTCYVLSPEERNFDHASRLIYGDYLLMRTNEFLPETVEIPDDISKLVQKVYDPCEHLQNEDEAYRIAKEKEESRISDKESRAEAFCLCQPGRTFRSNILGILDTDAADGENGEAAVRDIDTSIEVILLHKNGDDQICMYDDDNTIIARNETPSEEQARSMAQYTVTLPPALCFRASETIDVLEKNAMRTEYAPWQKSSWLRGALFLIMEQDNTVNLCGYELSYHHQTGLTSRKGA